MASLDASAQGVYAIAATTFHPDGRLDLDGVGRLTDFYLGCGVSGLTILGVMGEAQKLDAAEALAVTRAVLSRTGTTPVIVGVSASGFAAMRSLAEAAMAAGAAGVMIAPPHTVRTDDAIVGYFAQAVAAIGGDAPFVIQDYPLVTGVSMTPGVIRRIANDHLSCRMLKHEDWPGLDKISALRAMQRDGTLGPLAILCGNGGLFLDFELARGADGAMTGYAFPDMLVDLVEASHSGERRRVHDVFDAHLPLLRYEQQQGIGLAVRKYVLMRRGAMKSDAQRMPASKLSETSRAEVEFLLSRLAQHDLRANLS